ncbi:primase [Stappia phage SI01]|uniref:Primase n=1 Tax=Stappia phage SI01 TaxID=2847766 RepID=A0AAE7SUS0_9CAUD|nr:primase [Stappia phage SI01]
MAKSVCSLMGTSANARQLDAALDGHRLLNEGKRPRVVVWLDGDRPGVVASRRLRDALLLMGYDVKEIKTPRDPKLYAYRTIKEYLS